MSSASGGRASSPPTSCFESRGRDGAGRHPQAVGSSARHRLNIFPYHAPFYWPDADPAIYRGYLDHTAEFIWVAWPPSLRRAPVPHAAPCRPSRDPRSDGDARGQGHPPARDAAAPRPGHRTWSSPRHAPSPRWIWSSRRGSTRLVMTPRAGTPVLVLSSQPKTDDLMAAMGLFRVPRVDRSHGDGLADRALHVARPERRECARADQESSARAPARESTSAWMGCWGCPRSDADTGPIPMRVLLAACRHAVPEPPAGTPPLEARRRCATEHVLTPRRRREQRRFSEARRSRAECPAASLMSSGRRAP